MILHTHRVETEPDPEPDEGDRIGIMADSHGDAGLIAAAAECLRARGCERLFHLGDICDTAHPESAAACLRQVAAHRIAAIRGNNEHTLLGDRPTSVTIDTLTAIAAMPLTRRAGSALLAHSLPYSKGTGARCLIEALTADRIRAFFHRYPGQVLFRGHSHQPELVRPRSAAWRREAMSPGRTYKLAAGESAVITCGALIEGLALIWDPSQALVTPVALIAGSA
jgi:predicted phosphodiesterase